MIMEFKTFIYPDEVTRFFTKTQFKPVSIIKNHVNGEFIAFYWRYATADDLTD